MLHHTSAYVHAVTAERLETARRRHVARDAGDLEGIVRSAVARDEYAWAALVRRFMARLIAVTRAHRLTADDADDVVQNTWLRLFEHIESLRTPAAIGAWLETTARRESLRIVTRPREEALDELTLEEPAASPDLVAELTTAERHARLNQAVERLPSRQRDLIRLMLSEREPTYVELSAALDMPIGSIGPTRARSLRRLRGDQALASALDRAT
jgi:RNA polymerase sigma factor (sigma-70 family)